MSSRPSRSKSGWPPPPMLKGKTALVTGGSRGIGRGIANEFADKGADVALFYAGNSAAADEAVKELAAKGGRAKAYRCDVANFDAVAGATKQVIEDFGAVDILVNNAGVVRDNLLLALSEDDFDAVVDTSLKGAFNMIRHLYRHMMRRPAGRIINMGSVVGLTGNKGQANYSAAKAGLVGLTKSVAQELAGRGVTCNLIAPGFIESDMTDAIPEKAKQEILNGIPAKRPGTPKDIAALAAFLASDAAGYITGQSICVDGGLSM